MMNRRPQIDVLNMSTNPMDIIPGVPMGLQQAMEFSNRVNAAKLATVNKALDGAIQAQPQGYSGMSSFSDTQEAPGTFVRRAAGGPVSSSSTYLTGEPRAPRKAKTVDKWGREVDANGNLLKGGANVGPVAIQMGSYGGFQGSTSRIQGGSYADIGMEEAGGLNEFYALQENRDAPAFFQGSQSKGPASVAEIAAQAKERGKPFLGPMERRATGGPVKPRTPTTVGEDLGTMYAAENGPIMVNGRPVSNPNAEVLITPGTGSLKQLGKTGPEVLNTQRPGYVIPAPQNSQAMAMGQMMPDPSTPNGTAFADPISNPPAAAVPSYGAFDIENFTTSDGGFDRTGRVNARRWARSKEGKAALGQDALKRVEDARKMGMEEVIYQRRRGDQQQDALTAEERRKQDAKDADAEEEDSILSMADAMTQAGLLDASSAAVIAKAKGSKGKKLAFEFAQKQAAEKLREQQNSVTGLGVMTSPDGNFALPVFERPTGKSPAGSAYPVPKTKAPMPPPKGMVAVGADSDGSIRYAPVEKKSSKAKTRKVMTDTGRMVDLEVDYELPAGWTEIKTKAKAKPASGKTPAATAKPAPAAATPAATTRTPSTFLQKVKASGA
jgi:hypothetical protein